MIRSPSYSSWRSELGLIRDTVSSLGLVKRDVHITASASVTNACHFRHALALDERRVKFMPEYFLEMNAHHIEIRSPRLAVSDVQEIWFAGCHGDVYVIYRWKPTELTSSCLAVGPAGQMSRGSRFLTLHTTNVTLFILAM